MESGADLVQHQAKAAARALQDDVRYIEFGLKDSSTTSDSAIMAINMFISKREALSKAGVYLELIESIVSVACSRCSPREATCIEALVAAQFLLVHCSIASTNTACNQASQVSTAKLCKLLTNMLSCRPYFSVQLDESQGFEHSPQALLLAAVRIIVEDLMLCEQVKPEAQKSGLLSQLKYIATENMSVLMGKRSPTFTERASACMWFANMSVASLERLTAANTENNLELLNSVVELSPGKPVEFPAVPLACLQLVQNTQIMKNKATQICVAACLRLLMNLSHSQAGSSVIAQLGGVETCASIVYELCTKRHSVLETLPAEAHQDDAGLLPSTQDFLNVQSQELNGATVQGLERPAPDMSLALSYQQPISSALCVLTNMVEFCETTAHVIADLGVFPRAQGSTGRRRENTGKPKSQSCVKTSEELEEASNRQEGNQEGIRSCKDESSQQGKPKRLATGSRRRLGGRIKDAASEKCGEAKADMTAEAAERHEQSVRQVRSGGKTNGKFVTYVSDLLQSAWEYTKNMNDNPENGTEQSIEKDTQVNQLRMYVSIFLGALVYRSPSMAEEITNILDTKALEKELQAGLHFYTAHGAIQESSQKFLQLAVDSLKNLMT